MKIKSYTIGRAFLALSFILLPAIHSLAQDVKLKGAVIGTESCYDYSTGAISTKINTPSNAFDGNMETFVATYERSHTWVGLDLGTPHVITRVGWSPRNDSSGPKRVLLGLFEGSNRDDFMDAVPLYMITTKGTIGVMDYADVNVSRGFRYVRWCGPADSRCNVAEIEFWGHEGEGDDSQFYQLTNIPTLSYHTYSGKEPYDKVTELESEMCIIYENGTLIQEYPITARERGNGSRDASMKKRPYRIKFNDGKSHHMLKGADIQSPAKSKKWVLMPNWREKSLIRNNVAFEMSRRLGMLYTPWIQHVDVIVNGEYKGNYQLADQITIDPNRIDIDDLQPEDVEEPNISGGYLLEVDAYATSEPSYFYSNKGIPVTIKYPDSDDIVGAQKTYIRNYFNTMESALWKANFRDSNGYRQYFDLHSFLQQFIVSEFAGNTDAYYSVYMFKARDDAQFHVAPVWDFDLSMDNDRRVYPACGKSNWLYNYGSAASGMRDFVNRILSDNAAFNDLCAMWAEMRDNQLFTAQSMTAYVDSLAQVIDESQKLNFTRWDNLSEFLALQQFAPGTYEGEIDIVKTALKNRIAWIDKKLGYESVEKVDPNDTLYIIRNAQEMATYVHAINKQGLIHLNGRLEADVDLSSVTIDPIGTTEYPFSAQFDGQNHILSGLKIDKSQDGVGLFGTVATGSVIKGITLDKSCSISGKNNVGFVGTTQGVGTVTLFGLANQGDVYASGKRAGGILGACGNDETTMEISYCYTTGSVSATDEAGALSGSLGTNAMVTSCYNIATISGNTAGKSFAPNSGATFTRCFHLSKETQNGITKLSTNNVTRGDLCYRINDHTNGARPIFYQNLGADDYPVLQRHAEVIRQGSSYINKEEFSIRTAEEMVEFASLVNSGQYGLKGELLADIDFTGVTMQPIGTTDNPYVGTFDGKGHRISNLTLKSNEDYFGLFRVVGDGCVIQNLILDKTCTISGGSYTALVGATLRNDGKVYLTNLGNEGTVTGNVNVGAIFGCQMGSVTTVYVDACYSCGTIEGTRESGALTGYINKGYIRNSWSSANITGWYAVADKPFALLYCTASNNYCTTGPLNTGFDITLISDEQVRNGELCYNLNQKDDSEKDVWYQNIGTDEHPVLDSSHAAVILKDGNYQNEGGNGITSLSSSSQPQYFTPSGVQTDGRQRGLHIIKTSDGKALKILRK